MTQQYRQVLQERDLAERADVENLQQEFFASKTQAASLIADHDVQLDSTQVASSNVLLQEGQQTQKMKPSSIGIEVC